MEYARNAVRMSALMKQRVIHVYTHDSIGLGEDGPTHQPIEQIASLRGTPNLNTWRPADTVEAASRSLPKYTEESIANLVNKLIDSQMEEKLFHKAPITFQEIDRIKKLFIEKLKTIYHSRIVYPELNTEKKATPTQ